MKKYFFSSINCLWFTVFMYKKGKMSENILMLKIKNKANFPITKFSFFEKKVKLFKCL
jgi:hypothetical protein